MKSKIRHIVLSSASFLLAVFCCAQERNFDIVDSLIDRRETVNARELLGTIDTNSLNKYQKGRYYFLSGKLADLRNQTDVSVEQWLLAKSIFQSIDSLDRVAIINLKIAETLNSLQEPSLNPDQFIREYLSYSEKKGDPGMLSAAYMQLGKIFINSEPRKTIDYFRKALRENLKTQDSLMNAKIHHNLGVLYGEHTQEKDSAFYHYEIALREYRKRDLKDFVYYIYNNKASVYKNFKEYDSAIYWYQKADSFTVKEYTKGNKRFLYQNMAETYKLKNDFQNALKFLELENVYSDSINQEEQNKTLLDVQTKYEVEKKENENLKLKQDRIWLISVLGILLLLLVIGYLLYRNLKNKKELTEREAEVHREKLEKALKNQELAGIDAMIEGQEKERQRIANDLHDNLGSLLATLKLHFQNLKIRKDRLKEEEDKIMRQTDDLIDEAYKQVRNIAHLKNAGLKAQEGLLPAIKNFASKVSASNRLIIEVKDHGMEERLENSLEILLFRIIQELITNIIKHANATEAFIHLTHHGNFINLMVEDNGKGFDLHEMKLKEGMGIHSIQKRIEHMDGKVDIDSIPGNGTTIIIDIPVK